jgi:hypothetical protein
MELIAGDVEAFHCGFADLDALLVAARVERAFDLQTGLGGRRPDQLDHGKAIRQRRPRQSLKPPSPASANAVLNLFELLSMLDRDCIEDAQIRNST